MADDIRIDIILDDKRAQEALKRFSKTVRQISKDVKLLQTNFGRVFKEVDKVNKALGKTVKSTRQFQKALQSSNKTSMSLTKTIDRNSKSLQTVARRSERIAKQNNRITKSISSQSTSLKGVRKNALAVGASFSSVKAAAAGTLAILTTIGAVRGFKTIIDAAVSAESALIGLQAVASKTGNSMDEATEAAKRLEGEGLIPLRASAASLKNLLASGFNLEESIALFESLRDAAAFNRQGQLSMAQAIERSTEGVKNQNSILLDNAGITKNISVFYKEYAAELNKGSGSLTEAEKRQAIYNGVLREGSLFAGNFVTSLQTFQGATGLASTQATLLAQTLGELFTKNAAVVAVVKAVGKAFTALRKNIAATDKTGRTWIKSGIIKIIDSMGIMITTTGIVVKTLALFRRGILNIGFIVTEVAASFVDFGASLIDNFLQPLLTTIRVAAKLETRLEGLGLGSGLGKSLKAAVIDIEVLSNTVNKAGDEIRQGFDNATAGVQKEVQEIDKLAEGFDKAAQTAANLSEEIAKIDVSKPIEIEVKRSDTLFEQPLGDKASKTDSSTSTSNSSSVSKSGSTTPSSPSIGKGIGSAVVSGFSGVLSSVRNTSDGEAVSKAEKESQVADNRVDELQKAIQQTEIVLDSSDATKDEREQALRSQKDLQKVLVTEQKKAVQAKGKVEEKQSEQRNKEGAREFVTGVSAGIADVFLPGLGQAVGPLVGALSQGPEAVKEFVGGIIDAVPTIIDSLIEAAPVLIETLVDKAPQIITKLAEAAPKLINTLVAKAPDIIISLVKSAPDIIIALAKAVPQVAFALAKAMPTVAIELTKEIVKSVIKAGQNIFSSIFKGLKDLFKFPALNKFIDVFKQLFKPLQQLVKSISGVFGGGGGGGSGPITGIKGSPLATGGIVTGPGTKDTIPAVLTPGELVIDRTTGPRLMRFIDEFGGQGKPTGNDTDTLVLAQILNELKKEKTVSTSITLDQDTLAEVLLRLNQDNQRTG